MDEKEFWIALEFRLTREFAELEDPRLKYFWCDGLIPAEYYFDPPPRIHGKAWICQNANKKDSEAHRLWDLKVLLPASANSASIAWELLVPDEARTAWVTLDSTQHKIQLDLREQ